MGKDKKSSVEELKGVEFAKVRVDETARWMKANNVTLATTFKPLTNAATSVKNTVKNSLNTIKQTLNKTGKTLNSKLNKKTVIDGQNAIKKIRKTKIKNLPSKQRIWV